MIIPSDPFALQLFRKSIPNLSLRSINWSNISLEKPIIDPDLLHLTLRDLTNRKPIPQSANWEYSLRGVFAESPYHHNPVMEPITDRLDYQFHEFADSVYITNYHNINLTNPITHRLTIIVSKYAASKPLRRYLRKLLKDFNG